MTLPLDAPERPTPVQTTAEGPLGRQSVRLPGAELRCAEGGHVCALLMEGQRLHGATFGVVGAIKPSIDLWADEGRLPGYMRPAPR